MPPIAREVRDYIASHPSVSDGLKMGIINYSALARKISKELGIRQKEAVLAACRRYPVEKLRGYSEDAVRRMLQRSRIQTRTKVATITVIEGVDVLQRLGEDRKSTRLNSSHITISYAVFCLKKKKKKN